MPYVRKPRTVRKTYKKRYAGKRTTLDTKIRAIAKQVTLRQQETKHVITNLTLSQMYHNSPLRLENQLLRTTQGVGDGATNSRIGDEITLRGLKLYFQMENMYDRPNVTYKVWVVKGRDSLLSVVAPLKTVTGCTVLDPMDTEQVKVVTTRTYKFGQNNDYSASTGKRLTNHRTLWIPLNNQKYKYVTNGGQIGQWYNLALYVGVYDASNSLISDHIANFTCAYELFFKDS